MGGFSRRKGARGENAVKSILSNILAPVYQQAGLPAPTIERNLDQVRAGGCDLRCLCFAAEVKNTTKLALAAWWEQCERQAEIDGLQPLLVYKHARAWRYRLRAPVVSGALATHPLLIDMSESDFAAWLQIYARQHIQQEKIE